MEGSACVSGEGVISGKVISGSKGPQRLAQRASGVVGVCHLFRIAATDKLCREALA